MVQAADVDEDGTPVEPRKAIRDLRKAVNRQRRIILSKVQTKFTAKPKEMELVAKLRLPGNEDLLSVLDLQVALGREMSGSLATRLRRTMAVHGIRCSKPFYGYYLRCRHGLSSSAVPTLSTTTGRGTGGSIIREDGRRRW